MKFHTLYYIKSPRLRLNQAYRKKWFFFVFLVFICFFVATLAYISYLLFIIFLFRPLGRIIGRKAALFSIIRTKKNRKIERETSKILCFTPFLPPIPLRFPAFLSLFPLFSRSLSCFSSVFLSPLECSSRIYTLFNIRVRARTLIILYDYPQSTHQKFRKIKKAGDCYQPNIPRTCFLDACFILQHLALAHVADAGQGTC